MAGLMSTYRWQQARAECLRRSQTCGICGQPIDMALRSPHPMSATVDHIIPRQHGGPVFDQANLRPAHRTCNVSRGNYTRRYVPKQSREW